MIDDFIENLYKKKVAEAANQDVETFLSTWYAKKDEDFLDEAQRKTVRTWTKNSTQKARQWFLAVFSAAYKERFNAHIVFEAHIQYENEQLMAKMSIPIFEWNLNLPIQDVYRVLDGWVPEGFDATKTRLLASLLDTGRRSCEILNDEFIFTKIDENTLEISKLAKQKDEKAFQFPVLYNADKSLALINEIRKDTRKFETIKKRIKFESLPEFKKLADAYGEYYKDHYNPMFTPHNIRMLYVAIMMQRFNISPQFSVGATFKFLGHANFAPGSHYIFVAHKEESVLGKRKSD